MNDSGKIARVRLGDFIEEFNELNTGNKIKIVKSVSVFKEFRDTNAKVDKSELSKYKIVQPGMMSYVQTTKNEKCFACAVNHYDYPIVVTSVNKVFRISKPEELDMDYLFLLLSRKEFDRFAIFNSWGSAREVFKWEDLTDIEIPLPGIEVQRELVAAYNGLKALAEQNEALQASISNACHAYIVDCRAKYPAQPLGQFIEESRENNKELQYGPELIEGVTSYSEFAPTRANVNEINMKPYKIVYPGYFAYNPSRLNIGSIALRTGPMCIVSHLYVVFKIKKIEKLLPEYLLTYFRRKEFHRMVDFYNFGSQRAEFNIREISEFQIPVPPIEVQRAIVEVFNCAERAKKIAAEARERMKTLCPALVQRAANT